MLSFMYALLVNECAGAAYSVGLDPYVGFLHTDRPGRQSLALDLMEEFRAPVADRFVLTMINKQQINARGFRKIMHPYLKEKVPVGLLPYVQAMLLARYLRGDINAYPPYFKR